MTLAECVLRPGHRLGPPKSDPGSTRRAVGSESGKERKQVQEEFVIRSPRWTSGAQSTGEEVGVFIHELLLLTDGRLLPEGVFSLSLSCNTTLHYISIGFQSNFGAPPTLSIIKRRSALEYDLIAIFLVISSAIFHYPVALFPPSYS